MLALKEKGLTRSLVGFKMLDKGIPRQAYDLYSIDNNLIGKVTSGTHSPSLNEPIGIGYVSIAHAAIGTEILVDIRGRKVKAQVCKTPFTKS
jgi:aminomethyltransferase